MNGLSIATAAEAATDLAPHSATAAALPCYCDVPPERLRRDEGFYRSARDPMLGTRGLWATFLGRTLPPAIVEVRA